ncbi:hypothetical protein O1611_g6725 [Lasiodiplodia mahajangana]|uniref:Uncharacterized protein n=1 Tax=Lasiodiplodia mahajangana TaxID=1108764 RepID=A0ACC2JHS7_9PEZI|nr:hypothetical protein O1611_g6725 [Lasiodiplodia mahajangana]
MQPPRNRALKQRRFPPIPPSPQNSLINKPDKLLSSLLLNHKPTIQDAANNRSLPTLRGAQVEEDPLSLIAAANNMFADNIDPTNPVPNLKRTLI